MTRLTVTSKGQVTFRKDVLQHLGIDSEHAYPDHNGRPMPILPFGKAIEELLPTA